MPIDCRSFFPSETYRNFVAEETIVMPETADLAVMVQQLSRQFARINADLVHGDISANQKLRNNTRFLPRVPAKPIAKMLERSMNRGLTTTFTNLGLVELPGEIEERVEMLEFVVADAPGLPYTFACVTVGDALTLTTTIQERYRTGSAWRLPLLLPSGLRHAGHAWRRQCRPSGARSPTGQRSARATARRLLQGRHGLHAHLHA